MTPAEKRLAAAMRDSSASTMVKLALADYQRLLASTQAAPVDDRLAVIKAENAKLHGKIDDLERRLRAAAKRETERTTAAPVKAKVACHCGRLMGADSRNRGSECRDCYRGNTKWGTKDLSAAVAQVNADPDRDFTNQGCWLAVAALVGEPVRATKDAAKHRGLTVHPRERRTVGCPGCGRQVVERLTQGAVLLCGACQARQWRGALMPLEVPNV